MVTIHDLPHGWKLTTIDEICSLENGNGFKPKDWDTKGLPIIRIQNLNGSKNFNYFSGKPEKRWLVEPGQILFAWAGVKGVSFGPKIWAGSTGVLNQHIYKIHENKNIDKRWLYWALVDVTRKIETSAHGFKTSLLHVRKDDITGQVIGLPSLREQQAISLALDSWTIAVSKTEEALEAKREHKRALMQRLLTGKFRFPEFAGQPWHPEKFSNLIIARDERATANNTLPIMTSSRRGLMLQSEYFGKQVASEDTSNYKIIRRDDFTYRSMSDDRQFFFNQLDSIDAGIISPAYAVFYTHNVDNTFFKYFICSDVFSRHLDGAIQGGTRVALKLAALMSVEARLPSLPEQQKIATVLSAADREIDHLTRKLDAYKQQKKGLMQQLLTGKKRIKLDRKEAA